MIYLFSGLGLFLNVPGTRLNGIFFAEFKFLNFASRVGGPIVLLATGLFYWSTRRSQRSEEKK